MASEQPQTMADIIARVAAKHGVPPARITRKVHSRHTLLVPRDEAMSACRATGQWSRAQIGKQFEVSAWAVMHAERRHIARRGDGAELRARKDDADV